MKDQWRKFTDRVKTGSGKAPVREPEWYNINPVFSDTHGNLEVCSKANDVLSDTSSTDSDITEPKKNRDSPDSEGQPGSLADNDAGESDCAVREQDKCTSSENTGIKWKRVKNVEVKPYARKKERIKSQTQAINEIAKSLKSLGESQKERSEMMLQAEKERHAEFLKFQTEQAELNKKHA